MINYEKRAIIIILSHGSRNPKAVMQFWEIVKTIQRKKNTITIEGAFLQLAEPLMSDVVAKVVNEGYTQIGVVPFFLMQGNHIEKDIPDLVSELEKKYSHVSFTVGSILSPDARLEDVLADRIEEVCI